MTAALEHLYNRLKNEGYPAAQLGGIFAAKPGYHNVRDALPSYDYSVQQADDQAGSGQWAAGLDVTLHDPADMARLTQRLLDLTNAHDPRIQILREWFGTLDGYNVIGRDVRENRPITSDDSHLWHCHASSFRRWAGDHAAMDELATAILGGSPTPPKPIGPSLLELNMFAVSSAGGMSIGGAGYWKGLDAEEWSQIATIPGLVTVYLGDNTRAYDVLRSACINGTGTNSLEEQES